MLRLAGRGALWGWAVLGLALSLAAGVGTTFIVVVWALGTLVAIVAGVLDARLTRWWGDRVAPQLAALRTRLQPGRTGAQERSAEGA